MNNLTLLNKYNIHIVDHGHKHCSAGWVSMECPFCIGDPGYHLGLNLEKNYFHCWRCGPKNSFKTVIALTGCSKAEAARANSKHASSSQVVAEKLHEHKKPLKNINLPYGSHHLLHDPHIIYLKKRGFDPIEIRKLWRVQGTSHLYNKKEGDYRWRIIIPIYFKGKLVSYQGRDITGTREPKYKACKKENEAMPHKHTLYGYDHAVKNKSVLITEGALDVWKLGPGAVGTYGTGFTHEQALLLLKWDIVHILFDAEKQAQKEADKLARFLSGFKKDVHIHKLTGANDAGELKQDDAKYLMKFLKIGV